MQPPATFAADFGGRGRLEDPMILLGASVRAAAQSASRAGIPVIGIDMFADSDTVAVCEQFFRLDAVGELPRLLRSLPPLPMMQVGGLAGGKGLLDNAAERHVVLGPSPQLHHQLKDPTTLAVIAQQAGLAFPRTIPAAGRPDDRPPPGDPSCVDEPRSGGSLQQPTSPTVPSSEAGRRAEAARPSKTGDPLPTRWLLKDPQQSGGLGVRWADVPASAHQGAAAAASSDSTRQPINPGLDDPVGIDEHAPRPMEGVWQQWIAGRSYGVSFLGDGGSSRILGICRSAFCRRGGLPFVYAGSTGPLAADAGMFESLSRLGQVLSEMGVKGLFGVDIIIDRWGRIWLLEINPRWTASSELVERSMLRRGVIPVGRSLISIARDALLGSGTDVLEGMEDLGRSAEDSSISVKRILYARRNLRIDRAALTRLKSLCGNDRLPIELCDLPPEGSEIRCGEPMLTLIATLEQFPRRRGDTWSRELRSKWQAIQQLGPDLLETC